VLTVFQLTCFWTVSFQLSSLHCTLVDNTVNAPPQPAKFVTCIGVVLFSVARFCLQGPVILQTKIAIKPTPRASLEQSSQGFVVPIVKLLQRCTQETQHLLRPAPPAVTSEKRLQCQKQYIPSHSITLFQQRGEKTLAPHRGDAPTVIVMARGESGCGQVGN
jgi:hypothetical protein